MANIRKAKQSERNGVEVGKTGTLRNAIESNRCSYRLSFIVLCLLAFIYGFTAQVIEGEGEEHFQQNVSQDTTTTCRWTEKEFSKYDNVPEFAASSDSTAYFSELESYLNNNYNPVEMNGLSYTGQVRIENRKIMFEGFGRIVEQRGVYVGSFVASHRSGFGKMVVNDGTIYIGEWANNQGNGIGMFRSGDLEETYTGGFKNGLKHGKGHLEYREKGEEYDYTGMMKDNKRHGWGYLKQIAKGFEFEGHFWDNSPTGYGRFRYPDGKIVQKCMDINLNTEMTIKTNLGGPYTVAAHELKCQEFEVIV